MKKERVVYEKISNIDYVVVILWILSGKKIAYAEEKRIDLSAETEEILNEQLYFIYLDSESFGINQNDFDELYIGEPIHSYECTTDNSLVEMDMLTYPLFCGDELVLLMNESVVNETKSVSLSQCFVEELSEYYVSGDAIALVYDAEKCYVMLENTTEVLSVFGYTLDSRDMLSECEYNGIVLSVIQPIMNLEYEISQQTRASYAYLSVPFISQNPPSNICWAASVACIGNYVASKNYTAEDIAQYVYGDPYNYGAGLGAAMLTLNKRYGVEYANLSESVAPSDSTLYTNILNGYPVYTRWSWSTSSSNGSHATVVRGILTDSYVMVMDPEFGFAVAYKSAGVYSYTSNYSGVTLSLYGYGAKY